MSFCSGSWGKSQQPSHQVKSAVYLQKADSCNTGGYFACALINYHEVLECVNELNPDELMSVHQKLGELNYKLGNFDSALVNFNYIINLPQVEEHYRIQAGAYGYKAKILWRFGDNKGATTNILESIKLSETTRDTSTLILNKVTLADIYVSMNKLDEGEVIYNETYELSLISNDSAGLVTSLEHKGVIEFFKKNYKKAITIFKEAHVINLSLKQELAAAINLGNIGESYLRINDNKNALRYLEAALEIELRHNFNSGIIYLYFTKGEVYHHKKEYQKAYDYYMKSLALMKSTGEIRERSFVYNLIAENFAAQNQFDKAYRYQQMYSADKDSIHTIEKNKQIEELQIKYQIEQKDRKNALLELQNLIAKEELTAKEKLITYQSIIGILILSSLIVLIYLAIKLNKRKSELLKANSTKDKLFKAIGHDLNGPINNISALTFLLSKELNGVNSEILPLLEKSSSKLSILIKDLLSWSLTQTDGLKFNTEKINTNELIDNCIDILEFAAKEKKIRYVKNVDALHLISSDKNAFSTIMRNILTNAIKFSSPNSEILIETELVSEKSRKMVLVKVQDQGTGFSKELVESILNADHWMSTLGTNLEKGSGIGFKLIKEFVKESGGNLSIFNNMEGGATVQFSLPHYEG